MGANSRHDSPVSSATFDTPDTSGRLDREHGHAIDVLLAIDTVALRHAFPAASTDPEAPTLLSGELSMFALAPGRGAIAATSGARVTLFADVGDIVRLRASSLSLQGEHTVALVHVAIPADLAVLGRASFVIVTGAMHHAPEVSDPTHIVSDALPDAHWRLPVQKHGRGECRIDLQVTSRDGGLVACFRTALGWEIL